MTLEDSKKQHVELGVTIRDELLIQRKGDDRNKIAEAIIYFASAYSDVSLESVWKIWEYAQEPKNKYKQKRTKWHIYEGLRRAGVDVDNHSMFEWEYEWLL